MQIAKGSSGMGFFLFSGTSDRQTRQWLKRAANRFGGKMIEIHCIHFMNNTEGMDFSFFLLHFIYK
jgi:hypothetical protein